MSSTKLDMQWESFTSHLTSWMKDLYEDARSCDVTLICADGQKLKAHSYILKACSSAFKSILEDTETVYLRGINPDQLKSLLEFMYLGKTVIEDSMLTELLELASEFKVKELGTVTNNVHEEITEESIEEILDQEEPLIDNIITDEHIFETEDAMKNVEVIIKNTKINAEDTLNSDRKQKENLKLKRFPCKECDYVAKNVRHLKVHIEAIHEGIKYNCKKCKAVSSSKSNLIRHTRVKH